jgi:hypothetical protein
MFSNSEEVSQIVIHEKLHNKNTEILNSIMMYYHMITKHGF